MNASKQPRSQKNLTTTCFSDNQLLLVQNETEIFIFHWIFPILFLLGVAGNSLNLTVLLSKKMRRCTANWLLSCMACADLFYFFVLAFRFLASFQAMAKSSWYYNFYRTRKHNLLAVGNWFSAASIWFVLAVTIERLIAIRFPLQAQFYLRKRRIYMAMICIFLSTFLLTFHYNLAFVKRFVLCYGTQIFIYNAHITEPRVEQFYPSWAKTYYQISALINIVLVVIAPTILMFTLNISLISSLKRQKTYFTCDSSSEASGRIHAAADVSIVSGDTVKLHV